MCLLLAPLGRDDQFYNFSKFPLDDEANFQVYISLQFMAKQICRHHLLGLMPQFLVEDLLLQLARQA